MKTCKTPWRLAATALALVLAFDRVGLRGRALQER